MSERLPRQVRFWIFHRHRWWLALLFVGITTGGSAKILAAPHFVLLIAIALSVVALIFDGIASVANWSHESPGAICRWCGDEQHQARPRNADDYRRTLWCWHFNRSTFGQVLGLIGALTVLGLVFLSPRSFDSFVTAAVVVTIGISFWVIHVERIHRLLQPFCPYCRGWDEGGVSEPSPEPTGTKEQV